MTDPGPLLQTAYINLLANLTLDSVAVPVWSGQAPNGQTGNYVILQRGETLNRADKTAPNDFVPITLDCVTRLRSGVISDIPCDALVAAIQNLLFPAFGQCALVVPGYTIWRSRLEGVRPLPNQTTGTDTLVRRIIRLSHQLTPGN
ncbi:hypothetical protein FAES_3989 [Fibrella aestuarina BUZ 2]|uniref:Uncharacterized protein n=1 Tax=Fibrella aestuarina BUZ 2 TaxID=1166018 RepID=I0KCY7_9BACT|nr:hypothetical protein [Fibrella aestuarina]CCH01990.1 hypothetical protein FAES_3989 [Fibrella aestuarina BUZ 2]